MNANATANRTSNDQDATIERGKTRSRDRKVGVEASRGRIDAGDESIWIPESDGTSTTERVGAGGGCMREIGGGVGGGSGRAGRGVGSATGQGVSTVITLSSAERLAGGSSITTEVGGDRNAGTGLDPGSTRMSSGRMLRTSNAIPPSVDPVDDVSGVRPCESSGSGTSNSTWHLGQATTVPAFDRATPSNWLHRKHRNLIGAAAMVVLPQRPTPGWGGASLLRMLSDSTLDCKNSRPGKAPRPTCGRAVSFLTEARGTRRVVKTPGCTAKLGRSFALPTSPNPDNETALTDGLTPTEPLSQCSHREEVS